MTERKRYTWKILTKIKQRLKKYKVKIGRIVRRWFIPKIVTLLGLVIDGAHRPEISERYKRSIPPLTGSLLLLDTTVSYPVLAWSVRNFLPLSPRWFRGNFPPRSGPATHNFLQQPIFHTSHQREHFKTQGWIGYVTLLAKTLQRVPDVYRIKSNFMA